MCQDSAAEFISISSILLGGSGKISTERHGVWPMRMKMLEDPIRTRRFYMSGGIPERVKDLKGNSSVKAKLMDQFFRIAQL